MTRFTHPLVAYAEAARPGATTARLLLGLAVGAALILGTVQLAGKGLGLLFADMLPPGAGLRETPYGVLLILAAFLAVWPALWVLLPLVHRRSARTLFGPSGRIDWRHFRLGLAVSLGVGIAAWSPLLVFQTDRLESFARLDAWLLYAAIAVPLLFVQTTAEELVFRGYLLQQFAARSFSVLGWSVLPSLAFAYAHPVDGPGIFSLSWFHFVFGLIMAAVTSRTANLGAAAGLHFGHNLINVLVIAPAAAVSGLALFTVPEAMDTYWPRLAYVAVMFVGAALFMGWMDLRFIRQWKAMKRAEAEARDRDEVPPLAAE